MRAPLDELNLQYLEVIEDSEEEIPLLSSEVPLSSAIPLTSDVTSQDVTSLVGDKSIGNVDDLIIDELSPSSGNKDWLHESKDIDGINHRPRDPDIINLDVTSDDNVTSSKRNDTVIDLENDDDIMLPQRNVQDTPPVKDINRNAQPTMINENNNKQVVNEQGSDLELPDNIHDNRYIKTKSRGKKLSEILGNSDLRIGLNRKFKIESLHKIKKPSVK